MDGKDEFDVAREIIRHEDGLINNRVTWLLVFQGFLFNAFVAGVGLLDKFRGDTKAVVCIQIGLFLLAAVGICTSLAAWNVVGIAFTQMAAVREWWQRTGHATTFPPLSGSLPSGCFYWFFSTGRMPFLLVAVWILLAVLAVVAIT